MMKASMANDLHAGNRLELDWLAGKVVALGRKYGIPTPGQEAVYAILKPYRMGRRQANDLGTLAGLLPRIPRSAQEHKGAISS
jgi:hypothetical protein